MRWSEKFEIALAIVFVALFAYNVLVWRGIVGDGTEWRPGVNVLLTGALALQAASPLAGRRSRVAKWLLVGASLVMLVLALRAL